MAGRFELSWLRPQNPQSWKYFKSGHLPKKKKEEKNLSSTVLKCYESLRKVICCCCSLLIKVWDLHMLDKCVITKLKPLWLNDLKRWKTRVRYTCLPKKTCSRPLWVSLSHTGKTRSQSLESLYSQFTMLLPLAIFITTLWRKSHLDL